jgi:antitoxin (DNA-binding transcriptional repressor) of toxin-antitoxin stability system
VTRVGIKNLKNRLSAYLRRVRRGHVLLVTDRDRVIAEIRPAGDDRNGASRLQSGLRRMAERGEATLRTKRPGPWKVEPLSGGPLPISAERLLEEVRADRV